MQVGKIIKNPEEQQVYNWHPHSSLERIANKSNVMFLASEKLSFYESKAGAGILSYRKDRILTSKNCKKATWIKRSIYDVDAIIGNRKNSSKTDGIYYAGIWQELGLKETSECEEWAKSLLR